MTDARLEKAIDKLLNDYGPHLMLGAMSRVFAGHAAKGIFMDPAYKVAYRVAANLIIAAEVEDNMTFAKTFKKGDRVGRIYASDARGTFCRYEWNADQAIVEWDDSTGQNVEHVAALRHVPVTVVGPVPPKPPDTCPWCGAETYLDNDVATIEPGNDTRRTILAVVCPECEFIEEVAK